MSAEVKAAAVRRRAAARQDKGVRTPPLAADEGFPPADAVEVARVLGAWGLKGGLRLKPYSARPQALLAARRWWLQAEKPGADAGEDAPRALRELQVQRARAQGEFVVAECAQLHDRDAAQLLAGARVFVSRADFPPVAEDEYYWVDLIGLAVRNRADVLLGTVTQLIETGPHCVLCIRRAQAAAPDAPDAPDAPELLIPFVAAYVDRVDRAAATIHVDWDLDA